MTRSAAAIQGTDKLDSNKNAINAQLLRRSGSARAGAKPTRTADEQSMASHRAATLNDLLRDPHGDAGAKAESIQSLSRFPAVAAAPVEGTKLTVLEHCLARLSRTAPATRRGQTEPPSAEHDQTFLDATLLMQQYTKLADGPLAAKLAPALGKAAMESLRAGANGAAVTTGLVQGGHMALGAERRREGLAAVSRSLEAKGDAVQVAEQHVQADFERLLGGKSNAARACRMPAVESYRREAVAELVLAGAARSADIVVDTSHFGRDGRVAQAVRNAVDELRDVHAMTAQLRAQHGAAAPSPTFLEQQPHLDRLTQLLSLFQSGHAPNPAELRDRL